MAAEATLTDLAVLLERFRAVRQASIDMCRPLAAEDYRIQPAAEVSPPWWNLGHTSWFFARNLLLPLEGEYTDTDRQLDFLLNSYYVSLGPRVKRGNRGHMCRPTNEQILEYRHSVDERLERLFETLPPERTDEAVFLLTVGIHHEQQHQELFHTEIKAIYHQPPAPLRPVYRPSGESRQVEGPVEAPAPSRGEDLAQTTYTRFPGGAIRCGFEGPDWCWDNEQPAHEVYLTPFALANRPITCGEFLEFLDDGGYRNPLLWLDNAWSMAEQFEWDAPLYWQRDEGRWWQFTLGGMKPIDPDEPVCHVSFYEADAFARWRRETFSEQGDVRLPTEYEWEHAARSSGASTEQANLLDSGRLHPRRIGQPDAEAGPQGMIGDVWEWTASYYQPYPGYRPFPGTLAEYNGKFMDNQRVMRGGSCLTTADHIRPTYRNFWSPETRFQMTGFRLAKEV